MELKRVEVELKNKMTRRKINPNIEIFQELYKNSKPKCKRLKNHTVKKKREDIRILEKRADALFQIAGKKLFPISVTGEPTEVIHHFVPKSQSNNLRYDFKNACPATNGWHYRHHYTSDPTLTDAFRKKFGQKRIDYLTKQRHISVKQTKERLDKVIEELNKIVFSSSLPF